MREIKFRGKRADNGEWVYGYYFEGFTGIPYILVLHDHILGMTEFYEVDPSTVGQYTGLKDKNGKGIYEWDIVRLWESVGAIGDLRREYAYPLPVEYCELWAQFVVTDRQNKLQFGIWQNFGAVEVIGNIYENPELLEGMK